MANKDQNPFENFFLHLSKAFLLNPKLTEPEEGSQTERETQTVRSQVESSDGLNHVQELVARLKRAIWGERL